MPVTGGSIFQITISPNKAWVYACNNINIWQWSFKTRDWFPLNIDAQKVQLDSDNKIWILHNNVIKDADGTAWSNNDCTDFFVDDLYIVCLNNFKRVAYYPKDHSSGILINHFYFG